MPAFIGSLPLTRPRTTPSSLCPYRTTFHVDTHISSTHHVFRHANKRRITLMSTSPGQQTQQQDVSIQNDQDPLPHGRNLNTEINGQHVAYDYIQGSSPTIVFLPGFYFSRYQQAKANALEIFAQRKGQAIIVEEYVGIGKSDGDFVRDGTLSSWISHTVALIDRLPDKAVLVGAGVGGWIMLHVAMQRPDKVVGLVGINPSVDFTHDLILPSLNAEQKQHIENEGVVEIPWGFRNYPISKALLDDAEQWLVLRGGEDSLPITRPIRLLQGLSDEEVPADRILKLVSAVQSEDCVVSFVKFGDHFLEDEADFERMCDAVTELSDKYFEYDLTSPSSG